MRLTAAAEIKMRFLFEKGAVQVMECYIQYTQEFEQACSRVEEILSRCSDPQEVVMDFMERE